jgi:hypothetical protein
VRLTTTCAAEPLWGDDRVHRDAVVTDKLKTRDLGDVHYGAGTSHGDDIHEHGGCAVHFFDRALVDELATGWILDELHAFEDGELPRHLRHGKRTVPR